MRWRGLTRKRFSFEVALGVMVFAIVGVPRHAAPVGSSVCHDRDNSGR